MKKKKLKIAGLHLWAVKLADVPLQFWITTPTDSIARAIEKAEKFFAKSENYAKETISSVVAHGTIDA